MKKQLMMAIAIVFSAGIALAQQNQTSNVTASNVVLKKESGALPAFNWENNTYDFKEIEKGKPKSAEFTFTNSGTAALSVSNVQTSCGCTVADYSKEPIMPGKTGFVKVTYNAANKGTFNKSVTITANTEPATQVLTIKGTVVE